jgi:MSHA biogenesis protein MshL
VHLRLVVVAALAGAPIVVGADQAPLRPLSAIQLEGGSAARQAPAQAPQTAPTPLAPVPVVRLDDTQQHPELGRRFSLELEGPQPVRDLIELLIAEETRLNLIIDPSIDAVFVGQLRDITIGEALDLIAEQANLDYSVRGNVIRVFPRELETRFWAIDYVITERQGSRGLSSSSGAGGTGTTGGGGTTTGAAGAAGAGGSGTGAGAGSSAQVGSTDQPNFFDELEAGVRTLISSEGALNIDRTASLLQVTDRTSRLDRIDAYLEAVMQRVTRQVMIEARVIEVELRDRLQAGLNWNAIFRRAGSALSIGQTLAPPGIFTLSGNIDDNFTFLASFFSEQGKVNVLQSPRVAAMNNQTALIQAGTQQVFFTSTTQRDPQGIIVQQTETPQTITVGVVLSVTPQISADGIIHLSMNPSITELAGTATSPLGATVPIVTQRATDTLVRVREGETIVLGGMMQDRSNLTTQKVPLLGDVPFVGHFFKRTDKTITKTDLVIMLTPTIMAPTDVPSQTSREIRRIDAAQRVVGKTR